MNDELQTLEQWRERALKAEARLAQLNVGRRVPVECVSCGLMIVYCDPIPAPRAPGLPGSDRE